jgi:general secretion pathway protein K
MPGRQRGVAVITALLLTTLAVTIVASLFWQQQVQVRSMENQRLHLQTKWILRGGIDLSRFVLLQDSFVGNTAVTRLEGIWATPLAETRLDDYIERERVEGERFDATLAGQISDAQGRFNLANLASGARPIPIQIEVFRRLLTNVQVDPSLAQAAAFAMARTQVSSSAAAGQLGNSGAQGQGAQSEGGGVEPIAFMRVEDLLSVQGFTPEALERLRPFVVVLPAAATTVNVNTAPAEVLSAIVANFSVSEAMALTIERKSRYFPSIEDFTGRLKLSGKAPVDGVGIGVKSRYFLVASRVRLYRAALDAQALIEVENNSNIVKLISIRDN